MAPHAAHGVPRVRRGVVVIITFCGLVCDCGRESLLSVIASMCTSLSDPLTRLYITGETGSRVLIDVHRIRRKILEIEIKGRD